MNWRMAALTAMAFLVLARGPALAGPDPVLSMVVTVKDKGGPVEGAKVTMTRVLTGKTWTGTTLASGVTWFTINSGKAAETYKFDVDNHGRLYSIKGKMGEGNLTTSLVVDYSKKKKVKGTFTKTGENTVCKCTFTYSPFQAGLTYQLIQTDVEPDLTLVEKEPYEQGLSVSLAKPSKWVFRVYNHDKLAGEQKFSLDATDVNKSISLTP